MTSYSSLTSRRIYSFWAIPLKAGPVVLPLFFTFLLSFLDVTSSFQLLQFCFVSLYSLSFLQFINFLSYCLVSLLTSCRSPVVLREVLRFTAKLADISANCAEHFIKYECLDYSLSVVQAAQVICMGWWVSRDAKAMKYWRRGNYTPYICLCRLNRSCAYPRYGCNCDINDYVWRENRELLTNMAELPVIQLRFGDTG